MEDSGIDSGEKNEKMVHGRNHESEESSSNEDEVEVIFRGVPNVPSKTTYVPQMSSCKMMQRKLELKVERAKRTYKKLIETEDSPQAKSSNIIPINRLQIPGHVENQPLVEYKSDHSDEEESPSFFPHPKSLKMQDFSDTFSIQELPVSNSDDEDSQTLELVPPSSEDRFLTKLSNFFCCSN